MTKAPKANKYLIGFLKSKINDGSTLLDIGCGPKLYSDPFLNICSKVLTVDAWSVTNPDILLDVEKNSLLPFLNGISYDYILLLDFIEHLDKTAGINLINDCKTICNKEIILLNTNKTYDGSQLIYKDILTVKEEFSVVNNIL